jgi:hypothetical protein
MRDFLDERPLKLRREPAGDRGYWRVIALALVLLLVSVLMLVLDRQGIITPAHLRLREVLQPLASWLTERRADLVSWWSTPRDVATMQPELPNWKPKTLV